MNTELYAPSYGNLVLHQGWPQQGKITPLGQADFRWTQKDFGTILFQEIKTNNYLLRYFVFRFFQEMTLQFKEKDEGFQSLLSIKGHLSYGLTGQKLHRISEGQFTLLNAGDLQTQATFPAGKECHIINTYYPEKTFADIVPLFPALKRDLKKAVRKPGFFLSAPRNVRHTILDATHEILFETYKPELQYYYWDLKLRQILFTQLAQTYTEQDGRMSTPLEKEKAALVCKIIEADISKHYSNDELAQKVDWSESSLKRAFHQEFGLGMYEYLRRLRMQKAKELLLQGEQVKKVAPAVGMRPTNFTIEFQKYFGYKATSLRQTKR